MELRAYRVQCLGARVWDLGLRAFRVYKGIRA